MVNIRFEVPKKMRDLAQQSGIKDTPYDLCLACPFFGESCDGPNVLAMTTDRWIEWANALAKKLKYTRAYIAESANLPLGTVNSVLGGKVNDVRHSTMQAITKVLVGGCWGNYPCHFAALMMDGELEETDELQELRSRLEESQKELETARNALAALRSEMSGRDYVSQADNRAITFLKDQIAFKDGQIKEKDKAIRRKEKIIAILGFLLAAMLITVIAVLAYDKANPDVGWFREIGAMLSYSKTAMKL